MRGRLKWHARDARFYLMGIPVHAGDGVELHCPRLDRWVPGRIETGHVGRVAYFWHADDSLPWPGPILLAVAIRGTAHEASQVVSAYPELRWPER